MCADKNKNIIGRKEYVRLNCVDIFGYTLKNSIITRFSKISFLFKSLFTTTVHFGTYWNVMSLRGETFLNFDTADLKEQRFSPSPPSIWDFRHGGFGLLVIYRIGYFGVVFDLAFQTCKNSCTYTFSKESSVVELGKLSR